ncbi:MAG: hypothetical protein ACKVJP_08980 [Flavobacteriales bacterium]|jgi:hypothetical protein|tara:strand:+ start:374 stop:520 length:147 start_codon:yes stop_codon:yes gene_type:complete
MNDTENTITIAIKRIKVRLDKRTVITLASLKALDFWKEKYPHLKIISQ